MVKKVFLGRVGSYRIGVRRGIRDKLCLALLSSLIFCGPTALNAQSHQFHMDDPGKRAEHQAFLDLIPSDAATHVAQADGRWSSPRTWQGGRVPEAGAKVLVPEGVEVTYDVVRRASIDWVRVDGTLTFATGRHTYLLTEFLGVTPEGALNIGTETQPVQGRYSATIAIDTRRGPLNQSSDPLLLGRGVILHGKTRIFGHNKVPYLTLAQDAESGDNFIDLNLPTEQSLGWRRGDILLVAGTDAELENNRLFGQGTTTPRQDRSNERFRDELVRITSLRTRGNRVRVFFKNVTNRATSRANINSLLWNHGRPSGSTFEPDELDVHVANLTRNVRFVSSRYRVPNQERGHFMVMHNFDAQVHNAIFKNLGRSDKKLIVDDPVSKGNVDGTPGLGLNPRGRYSLHLHRVGERSIDGSKAILERNVVWNTPGWGIVHHDSHADLIENVVFDSVGAGIVAEDSNELGLWKGNLSVKSTGEPDTNLDDGRFFDKERYGGRSRTENFDFGFSGSSYWIQGGGAGLELIDNIGVSSNAAAMDVFQRIDGFTHAIPENRFFGVDLISNTLLRNELVEAGITEVTPEHLPIRRNVGTQLYNSFRGIHTWLNKRNHGRKEGNFIMGSGPTHDYHSLFEDFKIWHVLNGVHHFYSTGQTMRKGLVVGDIERPVPFLPREQGNNQEGIGLSHNDGDANTLWFDQMRIEGFEYALQVVEGYNEEFEPKKLVPAARGELTNSQIANVGRAFVSTSTHSKSLNEFPELFVVDNCSIDYNEENSAPIARFSTSAVGRNIMRLDATDSFDPEQDREEDQYGTKGISAFGWDFDSDGSVDAWGQEVAHNFGGSGSFEVTLTVWDAHGESSTNSQTVMVNDRNVPLGLLLDGSFEEVDSQSLEDGRNGRLFRQTSRGEGWFGVGMKIGDGLVEKSGGDPRLYQVIRTGSVLKGRQSLNMEMINRDEEGAQNDIQVAVFGINGEFEIERWRDRAEPRRQQKSIRPLEYKALASEDVTAQVGGGSWESARVEFDAEDGFEYILIRISGKNFRGGDYFAIDNVSLKAAE